MNTILFHMSDTRRSLEQSRLEIILLATGVLVLVSLLGVVILICVSLKHPSRPLPRHTATAWGGSWNERWDAGPVEPYRDEGFFDNVLRRSVSIAEDVRKEVTNLKRLMTLNMVDHDTIPDQQNIGNPLEDTTTIGEELERRLLEHDSDCDGSNWCDLLDSPASSTGRDRQSGTVTKRPERAIVHDDSCDLEAQESDDCEE